MREAVLRGFNLKYALSEYASFEGSDLSDFKARGGSFVYASFQSALLYNADLTEADLRYANFESANFKGTDFSGSDLRGAKLYNADLRDTIGINPAHLCQEYIEGAKLPGYLIGAVFND